jgi:hypothetical protein
VISALTGDRMGREHRLWETLFRAPDHRQISRHKYAKQANQQEDGNQCPAASFIFSH